MTRLTGNPMQVVTSRMIGFTAVAIFAAAITAGCGGSGTSSGSTARVRAFNGVPNGGSATIYVNNGSANGTQNYGQASPYLYLSGGVETITFSLSNYSTNIYETLQRNFASGSAYTLITCGRADLSSTAPDYPKILVLTDNSNPIPAGSALLRFVNAAPDAGSSISATYGSLSLASSLLYGSIVDYTAVPAGQTTLTVHTAVGTTFTQSVNLASGQAYTIVFDEATIPTVTPPAAATYDIWQLTDM